MDFTIRIQGATPAELVAAVDRLRASLRGYEMMRAVSKKPVAHTVKVSAAEISFDPPLDFSGLQKMEGTNMAKKAAKKAPAKKK